MLLAFKHTHLIPDSDVFLCIFLDLLSFCPCPPIVFFDFPPCPTSLNIVLYPSHWQPPLTVPQQLVQHVMIMLFTSRRPKRVLPTRTCKPWAPGSTPVSSTAIVTPRPSYAGYLLQNDQAPVSFFGKSPATGKSQSTVDAMFDT